jgi:hypothetical protein
MTRLGTRDSVARAVRPAACGALLLALAAGSAVTSAAAAQTIADRVHAAPDGDVQITFASRPGVCGDGRDMVGLDHTFFMGTSVETYGNWSTPDRCQPGPVRVVLAVQHGDVTSVRTHVGGTATSGMETEIDHHVPTLGVVPAADAAHYFLSLASTLDNSVSRDALLPAVLADSVVITPDLLHIARDATRPTDTRRRAVMWTGMVGDESTVPPLEGIVEDANTELSVRDAALVALSRLPGGPPWMLELARNSREPVELRKKALFWAGQGDVPIASLSAAYDQLSESELKRQAIFVLSQRDERAATDKLFQIVRTDPDFRMRKQALFWLAQRDDPRVTKMIADLVMR